MPVTTSVYIHGPADYRVVWAKCVELAATPASARTTEHGGMLSASLSPGGRAWTWVEYGYAGPPLRAVTEPHTRHCPPDCSYQHAPACWIEACFDTPDAYRDDHGGPGTLHQRLVGGLGGWLSAQAISWSWRNQADGIIHDGPDGLDELARLDGPPPGPGGAGEPGRSA